MTSGITDLIKINPNIKAFLALYRIYTTIQHLKFLLTNIAFLKPFLQAFMYNAL